MTEHKADVEKVAQRLLEKEILTRYVARANSPDFARSMPGRRVDMIDLLGKRPFADKRDEMDKWLDENSKRGETSAPPPLDPQLGAGAPIAASKPVDQQECRP